MQRLLPLFIGVTLIGCGKGGSDGGDTAPEEDIGPDRDNDGWPDDEDCDPDDPYTNPGADDVPYDGKDNDCAGDGDLNDVDGDGYIGDMGGGDDCNDNNPDIVPGGVETCLNGLDDDCDEATSDNDCDGDGYDREAAGGEDCEDYDPARNPGVEEIWYDGVDQDCDGNDGDRDGDGEDATEAGGPDCDDADPERNTSAEEICGDGIDNNCDSSANQCFPAGPFQVDAAEASLYGDRAGGAAGAAVLGWRQDADGAGDIAVGSASADTVYLLRGPFEGSDSLGAGVVLLGSEGEGAGTALAGGAFTGAPTLAIGAPFASGGAGGGPAPMSPGGGPGGGGPGGGASITGAVYLVPGDTAGGTLAELAAVIFGQEDGDELGAALAAVEDVDGDGAADLFVGAPRAGDGGDGEAYLIAAGAATSADAYATFLATSNNGRSGAAVASAGDFDGDGIEDYLVGSPGAGSGAGEVGLYLGPVSGFRTLSDFDAYLFPTGGGAAGLGTAVAGIGDADGDGLDDFAAGAPGSDAAAEDAGAVYIVLGAASPEPYVADTDADHQLLGSGAGDAAGSALGAAGDLDGDGTGEALAGAPGADGGAGRAYLIMGPAAGVSALADGQASWGGLAAGDAAGTAVGGIDASGDGLDDLLIAAPGADSPLGEPGAGAVYIVFGQGI